MPFKNGRPPRPRRTCPGCGRQTYRPEPGRCRVCDPAALPGAARGPKPVARPVTPAPPVVVSEFTRRGHTCGVHL